MEAVAKYLSYGLSVIPLNRGIVPVGKWTPYQTGYITPSQFGNPFGFGLVCGRISGNLECLDIDCKYDETGTLYQDFCDRLDEHLPGILNCFVIEKTRNNGYHLVYRLNSEVQGNRKLAMSDKGLVLIETRGEGGYFACAPTPGYFFVQKDFSELVTLSEEEHDILMEVAQSFGSINATEYKPKYIPKVFQKNEETNDLTPFDDYDSEVGTLLHELETSGWSTKIGRDGVYYLTRPGKTKGVSATLCQKNQAGLENRFYLFSSSVPNIPQGKLLKPSAVYTFLKHDGDFSESAKDLYRQGYGDRMKQTTQQKSTGKFWVVLYNEKKDIYRLEINQDDFLVFVAEQGFAPMFLPDSGDSIFVKLQENVIKEVTIDEIRQEVFNRVNEFEYIINPEELNESGQFTKKQLREQIVICEDALFKDTKLKCIKAVKVKFNKDTKENSFFYFRNGFVKVSEKGKEFLPYSELDGLVWNTQILDRDYIETDLVGDYERFVQNVCKGDTLRYSALQTAIGYLLHRYKNPSNCKAIILNDEVISDSSEGGTGKSLIAGGIRNLRKVYTIDGKCFDPRKSFEFGGVGLDTDLVVFDDVRYDFDFERLFHRITDGFTVEEKGCPKIRIKPEDSPKFLITTNYVVRGENHSTNRRKVEYELSDYYGANLTPAEEFGKNFFSDWNTDEWAEFDFFMLRCAEMWLKEGLHESTSSNLEYKKARQETHPEFVEWFKFYFGQKKQGAGVEEVVSDLLSDFISYSDEHRQLYDLQRFRQEKFIKWLQTYCKYYKINCDIVRKRTHGKSGDNRERYFVCNSLPDFLFE